MTGSMRTDLRSLALFRVALGCVLLLQVVSGCLYTYEAYPLGWTTAPHALAADTYAFDVLMVLSGLSATFIVLGYCTRVALFTSWLLLVSLCLSFPGGVQASHTVVVAQSFLALFLPLNGFYSVDVALDRTSSVRTHIVTLPVIVLTIFGVLCVFVPSLMGMADEFESSSQDTLYMAAYGVGVALPAMVFFPVWPSSLRFGAVVLSFVAVLILASPNVSMTALPVLAGLLPLMPSTVWNWFTYNQGGKRRARLLIYYDRDCEFCLKICLLFRTFFALGSVPIEPAQNTDTIYRIMNQHDSWVVRDHDGETYVRWHAVLLLLRRSPIFRSLGWISTVVRMGRWADGLYGFIGHNRWLFSRLTKYILPFRPVAFETSPAGTVILAIWVLLLVLVNFTDFDALSSSVGAFPKWASNALGLVREWQVLL